MRWQFWRRSTNVVDYRDPNKPLRPEDEKPVIFRTLKELNEDTHGPLAVAAGEPQAQDSPAEKCPEVKPRRRPF